MALGQPAGSSIHQDKGETGFGLSSCSLRSLAPHEQRYAVIEKEALAATWTCDKFADYLVGKHCALETDHMPLVPLLCSFYLSKLPPRILRFRLRLKRFAPEVKYVQGS